MRRFAAGLACSTLLVILVAAGAACSDSADRSGPNGPSQASRHAEPPPIVTTTTAPAITSPDQLAAPKSATEAATVLTRVERGLRSDGVEPAPRLALGWEQQLAYGALSQHPEWIPEATAAVAPDVHDAVVANLAAASELTSPDLGPVPTEPPDWTILTPPPPGVLIGFYKEAEAQFGVRWQYVAAIHFVETRMGRIHGNSSAGAQGPMQFIPSTWAAYGNGGNVDDNHDAILGAGRYLAASNGANDIDRALYAYNPSTHYVAAIKHYADVMIADARAYDGYYAWQVYVTTTAGTMRLPEGWRRP